MNTWGIQCDPGVKSLILSGTEFKLPRTNITSSYASLADEAGRTVTPDQVVRVKSWNDKRGTRH